MNDLWSMLLLTLEVQISMGNAAASWKFWDLKLPDLESCESRKIGQLKWSRKDNQKWPPEDDQKCPRKDYQKLSSNVTRYDHARIKDDHKRHHRITKKDYDLSRIFWILRKKNSSWRNEVPNGEKWYQYIGTANLSQ